MGSRVIFVELPLLLIYFAILFFIPITDYFSEIHLAVNIIYLAIELCFVVYLFSIFLSSRLYLDIIDLVLFSFFIFAGFNFMREGALPVFSSRIYFVIQLFAFYIVSKRLTQNRDNLKLVLRVISISLIIEVAIVAGQFLKYFGGDHYETQMTGTFENSGLLSIYLVTVFPFARGLVPETWKKNRTGWVAGLTIELLLVLVLIATRSRVAIALLSVFYLLLFIRYYAKRKVVNKARLASLCLGSVAALILVSCVLLAGKRDSSNGRMLIWKITAINIHYGGILTGSGYGSFPVQFPYWQGDYFRHHPKDEREVLLSDFTKTAFNEYLQTFMELGLFGLCVLLTVICWILAKAGSWFFDDLYFPIACSALGIFLSSIFYYSLHCGALCVLLSILLAALSAHLANIRVVKMSGLFSKASIVVLVIFFFLLFVQDLKDIMHVKAWIEANEKSYQLDRDASVLYGRQMMYFGNNGLFLSNYGEYLYSIGEYGRAADVLARGTLYYPNENSLLYMSEAYLKSGRPSRAADMLKTLNDIVPNRFSPKYYLFRMYRDLKDSAKASDYATMILNLPVKVPSEAIDEIKNEARSYLRSN